MRRKKSFDFVSSFYSTHSKLMEQVYSNYTVSVSVVLIFVQRVQLLNSEDSSAHSVWCENQEIVMIVCSCQFLHIKSKIEINECEAGDYFVLFSCVSNQIVHRYAKFLTKFRPCIQQPSMNDFITSDWWTSITQQCEKYFRSLFRRDRVH